MMSQGTPNTCNVCGCFAADHYNGRTYFVNEQKEYSVDDTSKLSKFEMADQNLDRASRLVIDLLEEQEKSIQDFEECKQTIRNCEKFLQENAIRKSAFDSTAYLEEQIEVLRNKGTNDAKKQASILQEMLNNQKAMIAMKSGELVMDSDADKKVKIDQQYFKQVQTNLSAEKHRLTKQTKEDRDVNFWQGMASTLGSLFALH